MANILIIDDEPSILEILGSFLEDRGHAVTTAATGGEGLTEYFQRKPEIVILDIRLPDVNGLEVLQRIQKEPEPAKVMMITAHQSMATAIQAMKEGAYDYIRKPLNIHEIEAAINRALQAANLDQDAPLLEADAPPDDLETLIGKSQSMLEIFKQIGLVCQNRATVLIQGETGTGKELIARIIHRNSPYHTQPFITFDCSSVVDTLIESELFGHEKGAFTGASQTTKGKIEIAGKGTLFIDEIGELPLHVQGALLGFLQRREYMRVGGSQMLHAHCRILAATHRDLAELVQQRRFRQDLYYRLRVLTIRVPPLRDRRDDLPALMQYFLQKINLELGAVVFTWQAGVIEQFMAYAWPGNVRELENILTEIVVHAKGKVILTEDVARILGQYRSLTPPDAPPSDLAEMEKAQIQRILTETNWRRTEAAERLGISLPTLRDKIRKYGITPA